MNQLAQAAALAALEDVGYKERAVALVREGREALYAAFGEMGLEYVESQANFIFVRVGEGDAATDALMREGVIVRPGSAFGHPRMDSRSPSDSPRRMNAFSRSSGVFSPEAVLRGEIRQRR